MKFMTFKENAAWRARLAEGLWMNDDKAVEGMSKLPQPKPKMPPKAQPAPAKPTTVTRFVIQKPRLKPVSFGTP